VHTHLDALVTALYVRVDDLLRMSRSSWNFATAVPV
jgi:hypothetical protein